MCTSKVVAERKNVRLKLPQVVLSLDGREVVAASVSALRLRREKRCLN